MIGSDGSNQDRVVSGLFFLTGGSQANHAFWPDADIDLRRVRSSSDLHTWIACYPRDVFFGRTVRVRIVGRASQSTQPTGDPVREHTSAPRQICS
jgi:hypothetical protein